MIASISVGTSRRGSWVVQLVGALIANLPSCWRASKETRKSFRAPIEVTAYYLVPQPPSLTVPLTDQSPPWKGVSSVPRQLPRKEAGERHYLPECTLGTHANAYLHPSCTCLETRTSPGTTADGHVPEQYEPAVRRSEVDRRVASSRYEMAGQPRAELLPIS